MKNVLAGALGTLILAFPLFASASSVGAASDELLHVLAQVAFLKAEGSGKPVACALVATKEAVAAREPFIFAWSSYGANDLGEGQGSQWPRNGIATIVLERPGIYHYKFDFYGPSGAKATCEMSVVVFGAR